MAAGVKAVYLLNMTGNTTPEWIPLDSDDGVQVRFVNDVGELDGWESVIQPAPFTDTVEAVGYTSQVQHDKLIADLSGRWEFKEYCAVEEVP